MVKRDKFIVAKVSEKERKMIQEIAEAEGLSVSAYIRHYIFKIKAKSAKMEALPQGGKK